MWYLVTITVILLIVVVHFSKLVASGVVRCDPSHDRGVVVAVEVFDPDALDVKCIAMGVVFSLEVRFVPWVVVQYPKLLGVRPLLLDCC